ncbi:minor capsid protein [Ruminococcaceae bacterium OttesenSCG-928-D13]|nr:minor capsid protein [Ruminococcaceae bacterium OttesenSCG-928-D13]
MVRPIPRRLLIHSAALKTGKTEDEWGNPVWTGEIPLQRVRFEPTEKLKLSKDNKEVQCSLLMFFDTAHSTPSGQHFEVGQSIEWNGFLHEVAFVEFLYDDDRLHHLEVGLI